ARTAFRTGLAKAEREAATDPRDATVGARLALLCAKVGDKPRAEAEIARALHLSPESDETRETAIWTYEVLNEHEQAITVLKDSQDPVIDFVRQYPDLAELRKDSRFKELENSRRSQLEKSNAK